MVFNSNVGLATTSITSKDNGGSTIGIGSEYIDNVYQVASVSTVESNITGIGTTHIRRVQATVVGLGTPLVEYTQHPTTWAITVGDVLI